MKLKEKFINALILKVLIQKGEKNLKKLEHNTKHAVEVNERLLINILLQNKDSDYGKKYKFSEIRTVEDYKKRVPLTDFEDYIPYIDQMKENNARNLITSNPIVFYAMSSGSCGIPKDYPVCQEEIDCYSDYAATRLFASVNAYYKAKYGKHFPYGKGLNTIVVKSSLTKHGIRKGWISCAAVETQLKMLRHILVLPEEVLAPKDGCDVKYLQILYALMDTDMTFMVSNFMVYLVELINYAKRNWEMLCHDIETGTIDASIAVDPETRATLEKQLKPDPERANNLRALQKRGFPDPLIPKIWPRMTWIGAVGSNNFAPYTIKMRKLAGDEIFFDFMQYGASESLLGCARQAEEEAFVLIPDSCYYEFLPLDQEDYRNTLDISQVEIGKEYELVITNKAGLYRYRMKDVVRIMGFWNEMPMVQCAYRRNEMIRLTCEKTTDDMVNRLIQSFVDKTGVKLTDFSIYGDTKFTPPRYVLFLEPEEHINFDKLPSYEAFLEEKLEYLNDIYAGYVKDGTIAPLKLYISQQGTNKEYIQEKVAQGAMEHQIKPARVLDTEDKQKFFLDRIQKDQGEFTCY